jgi:hypothetical protein
MRRFSTSCVTVALFALVFSCGAGPRVGAGGMGVSVASPALATPRRQPSFVTLTDGRVLAVGGHDGGRALASCELFEPATGAWRVTGALRVARRGHAAVRLLDGRVLVVGGTQAASLGALAEAEVYEPATGLWTEVRPMAEARHEPAVVVLPDGRVLVAGGTDADRRPLRSAELFDPATGMWSGAASSGFVRGGVRTAVLLPGGKALFASGLQAELYDAATGRWEKAGPAGGAAGTHRVGHTVTLLPDGRVLVVGGGTARAAATAEVYSPETGEWTLVEAPALAREHHAAVVTVDGAVLVLGGEHVTTGTLASVERFDPATGTWGPADALEEPRGQAGAVLLPDGGVLVMGGVSAVGGLLAASEVYAPGSCVPAVCLADAGVCGLVQDGCGGTLDCGACGGCAECRAESVPVQ